MSLSAAIRSPVRRSRAAAVARFAGALSLPVLVLAALGHRFGVIPGDATVALVGLAFALAVLALAAGLAATITIWNGDRTGIGDVAAGIFYALPALALLALSFYALIAYPPLTDASTDTVNPPEFRVSDHARDPVVAETAAQYQAAAYPDLTARYYPVGVERAYEALKTVLAARGATITDDVPPGEGGNAAFIEATERTLLFGFTDDVAYRIAATSQGTRVDVRSASRVGGHDLGQNARRIRSVLRALDETLQGALQTPGGEEAPAAAPEPAPEPAPARP